jgi:hypothetical protein
MSPFSLKAFKAMIHAVEKSYGHSDYYESVFDSFTSGYSQRADFKKRVETFLKKEKSKEVS